MPHFTLVGASNYINSASEALLKSKVSDIILFLSLSLI